jgi:hypothetical protein
MFGLLIGAIACYRGLTVLRRCSRGRHFHYLQRRHGITAVIGFDTLFNIVYIVFFP